MGRPGKGKLRQSDTETRSAALAAWSNQLYASNIVPATYSSAVGNYHSPSVSVIP